jgi:predicted TIM-barrel fold metal-dependent hydrolase
MIDKQPFYDTHVHFFDLRHPTLRYEWLEPDAEDPDLGDYGAIKAQRYWPDDFIAETRFAGVEGVVHVQAALGSPDPVEETRWLETHNERLGTPNAIVAYVDLSQKRAVEQLARHADHPHVRGIRDLRYDDYLENPEWRAGYRLLESYGLICCDDPALDQMHLAAELARSTPAITLCIDHAGYPRRRDRDYFEHWRDQLALLAPCENVRMKISGLGMCDHRWTVESIRPWVLTCIDLFGVDRCFFGTNWPLDRLFSSYADVVDGYRECIADLTGDERHALLFANAARLFGPNPTAAATVAGATTG